MLKWFWSDDERWLRVLREQPVLFDVLCYLLAAEGLEHFVSQWMHSTLPNSILERIPEGYKDAWRGILLRSVIDVKLQLGLTTRSANDAIEFYFQFLENKGRSGPGSPLQRTTATATEAALTKRLSSEDGDFRTHYDRTDVRLFDRLCDVIRARSNTREIDYTYAYARLRLAHPVSPDAGPAFEFLQRLGAAADTQEIEAVIPSSHASKVDLNNFMKRTASILHTQQRIKECQLILDLRSKLLPDMRIYRQASNTTTAAQAKATAMRREHKDGRVI